MHEIGHALGLEHPHEGNILADEYDSAKYTIMSYNDPDEAYYTGEDGVRQFLISSTPMVLDVAALQHLYGASNHNPNDDTYTFDETKPFVKTIWDNGGIDTLDFSNFSTDLKVNLNQGVDSYSTISFSDWSMEDNLGLAYGTIIENANGGAGDDIITGNEADNALNGYAGNDVIYGGEGSDTFDRSGPDGGRSGADTFYGGLGNDTYHVYAENGSDRVIEYENEGFDTVRINLSSEYTLPDNVENLIVFSNDDDKVLTGNDLNNVIIAQGGDDSIYGLDGDDIIYCGPGDDTITGGAGSDTFSFRYGDGQNIITDFEIGSDLCKFFNDNGEEVWYSTDFNELYQTVYSIEDGTSVTLQFAPETSTEDILPPDLISISLAQDEYKVGETLSGIITLEDQSGIDRIELRFEKENDLQNNLIIVPEATSDPNVFTFQAPVPIEFGKYNFSWIYLVDSSSNINWSEAWNDGEIVSQNINGVPHFGLHSFDFSTGDFVVVEGLSNTETIGAIYAVNTGSGSNMVLEFYADESTVGASVMSFDAVVTFDTAAASYASVDIETGYLGFPNEADGVINLSGISLSGGSSADPLFTLTLTDQNTSEDLALYVSDVLINNEPLAGSTLIFSSGPITESIGAISALNTGSGTNVSLDFYVDPALIPEDVNSFDMVVRFDSNGADYVSADLGNFLGFPNANGDTITLSGISLSGVSSSDPLFTLNFTDLDVSEDFAVYVSDVLVNGASLEGSTLLIGEPDTFDISTTVATRDGSKISDVAIAYNDGNETKTVLSGNDGVSLASITSGSDVTVSGSLDYDSSTKSINSQDALDALRLAVGMDTQSGTSTAFDYFAADFNQDGKVSSQDALAILKYAVGLPTSEQAEWVFVDTNGDYSDISRTNTNYAEGVTIADLTSATQLSLTGILIGDVNDSYSGLIA